MCLKIIGHRVFFLVAVFFQVFWLRLLLSFSRNDVVVLIVVVVEGFYGVGFLIFCRWLGPKRGLGLGLGLAGVFYFGGVLGFHRQFLSFTVLRYTTTTTTLLAAVALSVVGR